MESILSLLGSPILGAVGGVLGTLFTTILAWAKSKQDHKQAVELKKLDLQATREANESAERLAAADRASTERMKGQEGALVRDQLASGEYSATLVHDATSMDTGGSLLLMVAEFIRRTYRAFITTCLLAAAVSFFFSDYADAAMRAEMVKATIGATVMAVTWWFADRSLARKLNG